jgi:hypothetical protein
MSPIQWTVLGSIFQGKRVSSRIIRKRIGNQLMIQESNNRRCSHSAVFLFLSGFSLVFSCTYNISAGPQKSSSFSYFLLVGEVL